MLARSILEGDRQHQLPAAVVDSVHVIRQAAEQMDALIQDLLDITRLEGGRLVVAPRLVDADWLMTRSLEALRPLADAGGVSLAAELAPDLPTLRVDPDRMRQLLSNLIGNAIKFTPAGGAVVTTVRATGDAVQFTVTDTGGGIPAEQLPFVFDRFFQLTSGPRLQARHGAGLGLPISRGIVEAHGGRIWIESVVGKGTSVHFLVPAAPPEPGVS
jgi:signal transduction histidine kinase